MADTCPTIPQFDYITAEDQFPAMVAGYGSGKTNAAVIRSITGKLRYPKLNRGFYEPTYDLVRMIAFPRFEEILTELGIPYRLYKSPLNYIEIEGHGKIFFRSMDAPSRIIGYEHADADVDELDTLKKDDAADVWQKIQARNRQVKPDGKPNTIGVTTTPEGFRFTYEKWQKNPQKGYRLIRASTRSNTHLPDSYVETLMNSYPEALISAYIEGQFVNLTSGSVYTNYDRDKNKTQREVKKGDVLHVGMDFNVGNMSAIFHVVDYDKENKVEIVSAVDEMIGGLDTPSVIESILEKYSDHRIIVYPDASGAARKTSNASATDISQLKKHFRVKNKPKNPFVKDRVASVQAMLCNSQGIMRYFVNTRLCPTVADNLEQQIYNKQGEPDKTQNKDHANDAIGYFINHEYPLINKAQLSKLYIGGF